MKRKNQSMTVVLYAVIFIFFAGISSSCRKTSVEIIKGNHTPLTQNENSAIENSSQRPVIYHAEWSEWGRAAKECRGWGLCDFSDCWFCDNGELVHGGPDSIQIPSPANHRGEIRFNTATGQGHLFIELKPNEIEQQEAIQQSKPFYIDQDIIKNNITLHNGIYQFDPLIGSHGGYKIDATITAGNGNSHGHGN